jgi:predicted nucleic acid-binding protein
VDTSFWIAVPEKTDQYHGRASAWSDYLVKWDAFILTTETVLWDEYVG